MSPCVRTTSPTREMRNNTRKGKHTGLCQISFCFVSRACLGKQSRAFFPNQKRKQRRIQEGEHFLNLTGAPNEFKRYNVGADMIHRLPGCRRSDLRERSWPLSFASVLSRACLGKRRSFYPFLIKKQGQQRRKTSRVVSRTQL